MSSPGWSGFSGRPPCLFYEFIRPHQQVVFKPQPRKSSLRDSSCRYNSSGPVRMEILVGASWMQIRLGRVVGFFRLYKVGLHTHSFSARAFALSFRVHSAITAACFIVGGRVNPSDRPTTRICNSGVQFVNPGTQRIPCRVAQRLDCSDDVAAVFENVLDSLFLWTSKYFDFEVS